MPMSVAAQLLLRLLPLRERKPYSAALDVRVASETPPDPNALLSMSASGQPIFDRRPSARDPVPVAKVSTPTAGAATSAPAPPRWGDYLSRVRSPTLGEIQRGQRVRISSEFRRLGEPDVGSWKQNAAPLPVPSGRRTRRETTRSDLLHSVWKRQRPLDRL